MFRVVCDRCGKDITDSGAFGEVSIRVYQDPNPEESLTKWVFDSGSQMEHYCEECVEKMIQFIRGADADSESEKADPAEPESGSGGVKPKGRRRQLDYGKILALKNAGWSNQKIADEMRMSKRAVEVAVCKARKMARQETVSEKEGEGK